MKPDAGTITLGIDRWLANPPVDPSQKMGLLTNQAACTRGGIAVHLALRQAGFRLMRIFSPEHGFGADAADGAAVRDVPANGTGVPVISLYGERMAPEPRHLQDLDFMVADLPDIGCRFYTYLWSLTHVMEACATSGTPLYVLDRPNPLGGNLSAVEGPMLDEANCGSFIGRWRIPLRHSLTLGELARHFARTRLPGLRLQVVCSAGWGRHTSVQASAGHFRQTSPAMRDAETAWLYPGTGLMEGVNLSEGRGTPRPFRQLGAPWIDSEKWLNAVKPELLPGIRFQAVQFTPSEGRHAGEACNGLRLSVTDPEAIRPVAAGIHLLQTLRECFGDQLQPALYPTAANPSGGGHLDRLLGVTNAYNRLMRGGNFETEVAAEWRGMFEPDLLYGDNGMRQALG